MQAVEEGEQPQQQGVVADLATPVHAQDAESGVLAQISPPKVPDLPEALELPSFPSVPYPGCRRRQAPLLGDHQGLPAGPHRPRRDQPVRAGPVGDLPRRSRAHPGQEAGIPIPTDVGNVRRTLLRHEAGMSSPKTADAPYARLYALAYGRPPEALLSNLRPASSGRALVVAHQFVPVYLGTEVEVLAQALGSTERRVGWAKTHHAELTLDDQTTGDLYLFSWGVAVFHRRTPLRPESVAELAVRRRDTHRDIRRRLAQHLAGLLDREELLARYVLTAFWLAEPAWAGRDLHTAMRLLTSPRALLGSDDAGLHHAEQIEKRLFNEGFAPDDLPPERLSFLFTTVMRHIIQFGVEVRETFRGGGTGTHRSSVPPHTRSVGVSWGGCSCCVGLRRR